MNHHGRQYKLLRFYADWCGPCRTMKPFINKALASPGLPKIELVESNVDKELLYNDYGISSVPTLVLLSNSYEVGRLVGLHGEKEIAAFLNEGCGTKK
jgi:thioredoxin-like negative regulator of GroEL